jgi:alpha-beta hydrolase superfamily lysophospholipase
VAAYDGDPLVHRGRITAGLGGQLLAQMRRFGDGVGRLTVPVLVLVGTDDTLVEPDGVRRLFARIGSTDKRLIEYPGLFHEIFNEPEQDAVLDDVVAWLDHHC